MTTTDQPIKKIKAIAKDDFAYYLNGELVGYAPTYLQAQAALNDLVYNLLARGNASPADLAPDEAEAVLEGQQLVAEAEAAQRELIELGRQAGVAETRTAEVCYDCAPPVYACPQHTSAPAVAAESLVVGCLIDCVNCGEPNPAPGDHIYCPDCLERHVQNWAAENDVWFAEQAAALNGPDYPAGWCAACDGTGLVVGPDRDVYDCPTCGAPPEAGGLANPLPAPPAAEVLGEGHSESASRYAWIDIRGWGWGAGSAPVVTRDAPATPPYLWGWRSANRRGVESGHEPMWPLSRDHDYGVLPDPCCPYFARAIPCPWPEDCPDCGPDNPTTTNPQTDTDGAELAAMLEAETALRDYAAFVAVPGSEAEAVCEWAAAHVRANVRPAEWPPFQERQHAA